MSEATHAQVGTTIPQLRAILTSAEDVEADTVLLRVETDASDPATVEVWLFSEAAEGMVGMIEVDPAGRVTELDG